MTKRMAAKWNLRQLPNKKYWIAFAILFALAYALFAHPDVVETSNHSFLLLDSVFKGQPLNFYNYVAEHPFGTGLYYLNNAHYNIVIYVIFAIAELPLYLVYLLFGVYSEPLIYFFGKLVSGGFYIACFPLVKKIAVQLGLSEKLSNWAALFFALSPGAFFSAAMMAQYDSICLFFILLGFLHWLNGNLAKCAFWMGFGAACKFFSLLLLVPLVLLAEKRPLHILKNGAISLWLLLPTSVLFMGRMPEGGVFNQIMLGRLFHAVVPAATETPIYPLLFLVLCAVAFLWRPANQNQHRRAGLWLCAASFSLLFLLVYWHPQWFILLAPFLILSTMLENERAGWYWVDVIMNFGFFLFCFVMFSGQLEANMFNWGIVGLAGGPVMGATALTLLGKIPYLIQTPMVLFGGALTLHMVLKFPASGGTPAGRLAGQNNTGIKEKTGRYLLLVFGLGMLCWLVPIAAAGILF